MPDAMPCTALMVVTVAMAVLMDRAMAARAALHLDQVGGHAFDARDARGRRCVGRNGRRNCQTKSEQSRCDK
jgi:hypothetical protein